MAENTKTNLKILKTIRKFISSNASLKLDSKIQSLDPNFAVKEKLFYYNFKLSSYNSKEFIEKMQKKMQSIVNINKVANFINNISKTKGIKIESFSVVDCNKLKSGKRLFDVLGCLPQDKGFLTIVNQYRLNHEELNNDKDIVINIGNLKETEIAALTIILQQLKKIGLVQWFLLDEKNKNIHLPLESSQFLHGKWFEIVVLFEISKYFSEFVIISSLEYTKRNSIGEIDIYIVNNNGNIILIEIKSTINPEMLRKGIQQLQRYAKLFNIPISSCFLIAFDDQLDLKLQNRFLNFKERYSNDVNIMEFQEMHTLFNELVKKDEK